MCAGVEAVTYLVEDKPVSDVALVVDILETFSNVIIILPTDSPVEKSKPHAREEDCDHSEINEWSPCLIICLTPTCRR